MGLALLTLGIAGVTFGVRGYLQHGTTEFIALTVIGLVAEVFGGFAILRQKRRVGNSIEASQKK